MEEPRHALDPDDPDSIAPVADHPRHGPDAAIGEPSPEHAEPAASWEPPEADAAPRHGGGDTAPEPGRADHTAEPAPERAVAHDPERAAEPAPERAAGHTPEHAAGDAPAKTAVPAHSPAAGRPADATTQGDDEDAPRQPASPEAAPAVLRARGLSVATSHDPAFTGVDIDVPAGRFAAVVGAAGTGKSTLLLALTARMRPVRGELWVGGLNAMKRPGRVRSQTAIARISDLIEPENTLTLDECLTERTLFDAANPRSRQALFLHAARLVGLEIPLDTLFGDLTPLDQTRATLALACVRPSTFIALDDLDYDVTLTEQRLLWDGVAALAADGQPVIASTTERSVIPPEAITIDLEPEA